MTARIQKGCEVPEARLRIGLREKLAMLDVGDRLGPLTVTNTHHIYSTAKRLKIAVRTKIIKRLPGGKLRVNIWRVK